jgi:hypothetical protein
MIGRPKLGGGAAILFYNGRRKAISYEPRLNNFLKLEKHV